MSFVEQMPPVPSAVYGFVRRRGPMFWLAGVICVTVIIWASVVHSAYRHNERAAAQLQGAVPVSPQKVYWRIQHQNIDDVAVVVQPDPGGPTYTIDLTGVDGHDGTRANEGWQPATVRYGSVRYVPDMGVRYRLTKPPLAMAEPDYRHYTKDHPARRALEYFGVATAALTLMFGLAVRDDLRYARPRRGRSALRRRGGTVVDDDGDFRDRSAPGRKRSDEE
jgi:hypothetical protein